MFNPIPSMHLTKKTLNELLTEDPILFNGLVIPEGLTVNTLLDWILYLYGDMQTVWSTAAAAYKTIGVWSGIMLDAWNKMYAALVKQYEPLDNYNMIEQMTNDQTVHQFGKTNTETRNLARGKTGTETDAPNLTETETPNLTETRTPNLTKSGSNDVYGFDSASAVHKDASSEQETGTDTKTNTGTRTTTNTGQAVKTYNTSDSDTGTVGTVEGGSDTDTRNYKLTRSGNIGVTTSQQMLESEIRLRANHNMYEIITEQFRQEFMVCVW